MELLGDFGRIFFNALYDFRIPVAIGSAALAGLLALVAWRRGWLAAARRHPGRSGVVLAIALAVGLPLTWYLASPIFIRTALVEAAPTLAPVVVSTPTPGPTEAPPSPAPSDGTSAPPTAPPSPVATPFVVEAVAAGQFVGSDDFHFGRGTASILETSPGRYHLRLEDFSVRNGPDLYVYLSPDPDGYADDALELGTLKATDGSFGYDIPEGVDPARFRSAIIWCKQFSHLFATATFAER